jgi:two-component system LytT family response regulator
MKYHLSFSERSERNIHRPANSVSGPTTIIVDDEPPARALLREYLAEEDGVEIVAECANGREALEAIRSCAPDLVFLDVQMPGPTDGFDVLEALAADPPPGGLPQIVFSTAHDDYAVDAFEAGAADYLLKPYSRPRFQKALGRAREALGQDASTELVRVLRAAREANAPASEVPERLFVRWRGRIVPIETRAIAYVEADGDYAKLHTPEDTFLHSAGLGALAERLQAEPAEGDAGRPGTRRFLRVHRSAIIALAAVEHLASDGSGGYVATLRLGDGGDAATRKVRVSRSYAPAVRALVR